jgi:hypothetical protein
MMRMPNEFLDGPEGLKIKQSLRRSRRIWLQIENLEPRAKHSMRDADKDRLQQQVLRQMERCGRHAFRGPMALRLVVQTSEQNPTHSPNIAKNLLDLLGKPRPALGTRRRGLLYRDDRQVQALSVTCHHAAAMPSIHVQAMPLRDLLADLRIIQDMPPIDPAFDDSLDFDMAIEERNDLRRNEAEWRARLGNDGYECWLRYCRARAQEHLLGNAAFTPSALARMYNAFEQSPLHIRLGELPATEGSSDPYKQEIDRKLTAFQKDIGSLLVPAALEVAIRPAPPSRQGLTIDLDNVVRSYLIPRVIGILKPVTHFAFTLDDDARKSLARYAKDGDKNLPPLTTSMGVTRFDVWRLPPAREGSQGYVQMALVNDMTGYDDLFGQIDDEIDRWRDSLD